MRHWLVKSEPTVYSFDQLVAEKRTAWTGIRNNQARLWLLEMQPGDRLLYYHSNVGKEVVGVAEVVGTAYPDPTAEDPRWVCVDVAPVRALARTVSLQQFRDDPLLKDTYLVKQGRLSTMPLSPEQYARVLALAGE